MLRSIGADHVIDYIQEDFTKNGQRYDLILDVAAPRAVLHFRRSLAPTDAMSWWHARWLDSFRRACLEH